MLNRYTFEKAYRGFESLRHRHPLLLKVRAYRDSRPSLALGRSPRNRLSAIAVSGSPLRHRHLSREILAKNQNKAGVSTFASTFAAVLPSDGVRPGVDERERQTERPQVDGGDTSAGSRPNHWRHFVGEDGRQLRHVACQVAGGPHQVEDRLLRLCHAVEVAHRSRIAVSPITETGAGRRRLSIAKGI